MKGTTLNVIFTCCDRQNGSTEKDEGKCHDHDHHHRHYHHRHHHHDPKDDRLLIL